MRQLHNGWYQHCSLATRKTIWNCLRVQGVAKGKISKGGCRSWTNLIHNMQEKQQMTAISRPPLGMQRQFTIHILVEILMLISLLGGERPVFVWRILQSQLYIYKTQYNLLFILTNCVILCRKIDADFNKELRLLVTLLMSGSQQEPYLAHLVQALEAVERAASHPSSSLALSLFKH